MCIFSSSAGIESIIKGYKQCDVLFIKGYHPPLYSWFHTVNTILIEGSEKQEITMIGEYKSKFQGRVWKKHKVSCDQKKRLFFWLSQLQSVHLTNPCR